MRKRNIILAGSIAAAALVIGGTIFFQHMNYKNKWYADTTINGIDVSGQTLEASREQLRSRYKDYSLSIRGRDNGALTISGSDIDFVFDFGEEFDAAWKEQHSEFQLFPKKHNYDISYNVTYDNQKLHTVVQQSELYAGSDEYSIVSPKNASVAYSKKKHQYICKEERLGNTLLLDPFLNVLHQALRHAAVSVSLTEENVESEVYEAPAITSESDILQQRLKLCNYAVVRYITWNLGSGVKEVITPNEISKWIRVGNDKITYKKTKIENWLEKLCLKYKTVGKTRKVKVHTKKIVKIVGGDYGWQLDYEKIVQQTKKMLKEEIDSSLIDAFIENPSGKNQRAITLKKKAPYLNTAAVMNFDKYPTDYDTKNYVEVSLKDQMVYVFRKGKVAFSCRCITGRPEEGRRTPTGAYFIKEHRTHYTLTGADYSTPVDNWVRITWTGTGFHPATWQSWGSWTNTAYLTKGSHGCINLEPADALKIYQMTKYREFCFIY